MNLFASLREIRKRRRTYETLRRLDAHMLRDIGFERDQLDTYNDFARLQDIGR